jgi:hypothetical protein
MQQIDATAVVIYSRAPTLHRLKADQQEAMMLHLQGIE